MDEIRQRLQQLAGIKVHPRDAQENLATIARAERLYEESLGDERAFLQAWLARFKGEVERQDPGAIAAMREELEYVLSQMESSRL
jgi:molecular chaperone HscC